MFDVIIDWIQKKKVVAAGYLILVLLLTITMPAFASMSMQKVLKPMAEMIQQIGDIQFQQVYGAAIAAYSKFDTLEDIQNSSSSQNKEAIRLALGIPEVKKLLMLVDTEKTLMFCTYFGV